MNANMEHTIAMWMPTAPTQKVHFIALVTRDTQEMELLALVSRILAEWNNNFEN